MGLNSIPTTKQVLYPRRALKAAAFITLLAPPVGFLAFMVPMEIHSLVTEGISLDALITAPKILLFGSLFSFVIGGLPALIAAACSGWLIWRNGTISYLQAVAIALVAGAVYVGMTQLPAVVQGEKVEVGLFGMIAGLSLVSAVICRWSMGRIGLLPVGSPGPGKS